MAANLTKHTFRQQEQIRTTIQTGRLIKRLEQFGLAETDEGGQIVDIESNRLKAIEILLRKSLPDLSSVTLTGDPDNPVGLLLRLERVVIDAKNSNG